MLDLLTPLPSLFYQPTRAVALVRERVSLTKAAVFALIACALYLIYKAGIFTAPPNLRISFDIIKQILNAASVLLFVALVLVPLVIIVTNLFSKRIDARLVLQQEFIGVATATLYVCAIACFVALPLLVIMRLTGLEAAADAAWATSDGLKATIESLPRDAPPERQLALAQQMLASVWTSVWVNVLSQPQLFVIIWLPAIVRESLRVEWWRAVVSGAVALIFSALASPLFLIFQLLLRSPFIVVVLFIIGRGYFTELTRAQRARTDFKQRLHAATLNPADASAHYQLGLLYQQRGERDEAKGRFARAVEIDPEEADADYQLGRMSREDGNLAEAVAHFEQVVRRAPSHAQNEVWREIGATYLAAGQFKDASEALDRFLDERQSDPEGLYLMGRALAGLGRTEEAAEQMRLCIEAVETAPAYKYRTDKRWRNEAQQFLRSQA